MRKQVLQYDDVMNIQREKFYRQRRKVLSGHDLYSDIIYMMEKEAERILKSYISPEQKVEEYVYDYLVNMIREIHSVAPQLSKLEVKDIQSMRYEPMYNKIKDMFVESYRNHEIEIIDFYNKVLSDYGSEFEKQEAFSDNNVVRTLEKDILLKVIDAKWIDHLHNIDMVREGIGLRAYGQKDPLIEYKKEAYDLFNGLMEEIQSDTVKHLFRTRFGVQIVSDNEEESV
jgi:preprotein translocase subunit SecA